MTKMIHRTKKPYQKCHYDKNDTPYQKTVPKKRHQLKKKIILFCGIIIFGMKKDLKSFIFCAVSFLAGC